jgi:hypothetical protein
VLRVFVAVGLDNKLKPLPSSLAAGSYFFLLGSFNFTPQFAVLLFFGCGFWWTKWLAAFSKNSF